MKRVHWLLPIMTVCLMLSACGGQQRDLVDMKSATLDNDTVGVAWEGRIYVPFCVVSKKDCGEQIGYVDEDKNDRISEYKG